MTIHRIRRCSSIAVHGAFDLSVRFRTPLVLTPIVEVQQLPDLVRILDFGKVVAEHPVLEGRKQYRIDRSHRTGGNGGTRRTGVAAGVAIGRIGDHVPWRSLDIYQAVGAQLATGTRP